METPTNWKHAVHSAIEGIERSEEIGASLIYYVERLHAWNQVHNLTGLAHPEEMVAQLVCPSLALAPVLGKYKCLLDLGTGAGIPGMVLAICHPGQSWVLVERSQKKGRFLQQVITDLGCRNVTVRIADFTQMPFDRQVEAIVSRGSAKLGRQIGMTAAWREQGVPIYTVQTEKSLTEQAPALKEVSSSVVLDFKDAGLVLLKVR